MRSSSFLAAILFSAVALPSIARSELSPALLKAAGFVLTNREDFVPGPEDRILITKTHDGVIFQTDDPCIFQFRGIKGPQHEMTQINFSKIKKATIAVPAFNHFPVLRLEGDRGAWCVAKLSDTLVADPSFVLSESSDCSDFVEMTYSPSELVRLRDAVVFVNERFCGYAGKPY